MFEMLLVVSVIYTDAVGRELSRNPIEKSLLEAKMMSKGAENGQPVPNLMLKIDFGMLFKRANEIF